MKKMIYEFLEPSSKDKEKIWGRSIFVFDTNVLLNLYRYSKETRESLLTAIKSLQNKLWLPYQIGFEFMNDRYTVIYETIDRYEYLSKKNNEFMKEIREKLRLKNESESLQKLETIIEDWISEQKKKDLLVTSISEDKILDDILQLFEEKMGSNYTEKELNELYKEAKKRFEMKIPPGYKDDHKNKKEENSGYGDFILWKQIIKHAKDKNSSVVFVTHDQKEDWWNIVKGKTIGPRVELRREFHNETKKHILFYTMNSFLENVNRIGNQVISQKVLNEVNEYKPFDLSSYNSVMYADEMDEDILRNLFAHNFFSEKEELIRNIERVKNQIFKRERSIDDNNKAYERTKNPIILENIRNTEKKITKYRKELNRYITRLDEIDNQ